MAAVTCSVVDTRTGAPASGMRVILRSLSHQVSFFQDLTLPCGGGFQWNVASFMQSVTASTETIWLISFDTGTYFGTDPRTYISQTTSWPEVNVYFYLRKDQGYIVTMHIGPESYTARGLYTSLPFILRTDGNQVRGQYGMAGKPYPVEPRGLIQPQTPSSGFTEPQNFTIRKMPRDRPSLSTTWEPERSHIPSVNVGHTLGMPRAYPQTVGRRIRNKTVAFSKGQNEPRNKIQILSDS
ncbi:hypothetical protein F5884DRAFT_149377 [Xylogone sp. PMI_703]|nr:hypothetical protein F5884DRAFT_149377 [Xylogone sp. PMI_703]